MKLVGFRVPCWLICYDTRKSVQDKKGNWNFQLAAQYNAWY